MESIKAKIEEDALNHKIKIAVMRLDSARKSEAFWAQEISAARLNPNDFPKDILWTQIRKLKSYWKEAKSNIQFAESELGKLQIRRMLG